MSDSKLYIGNLSSRTDERYLKDAFSKYGRIVTVEMKRRYAFVDFQHKADAEAAISSMDGKEFDGSKLIVEWTRGPARTGRARGPRRYPERSDYRIEVANLPDRCHWSELKDHFRKAGEVVFGDVWGSKGVIEFKYKQDMEYALKELDGVRWKGYSLELRRDRRRSPSRSSSRDRRRSSRRSSRRSYSPDSRSHSRDRERERERERDRDRDSRRRKSSRSPSGGRSSKYQRSPNSKSPSRSPRSPSKEKRRESKEDNKKYDDRSPSPSKKADHRSPREENGNGEGDKKEDKEREREPEPAPRDDSPRESRKRENEENDNDNEDDRKRQRTD